MRGTALRVGWTMETDKSSGSTVPSPDGMPRKRRCRAEEMPLRDEISRFVRESSRCVPEDVATERTVILVAMVEAFEVDQLEVGTSSLQKLLLKLGTDEDNFCTSTALSKRCAGGLESF